MSEEEIIEYLKKVIKTIQESDMLFDEPANIRCGIKMEGAIQGLLDLYNKEKEKRVTLENLLQGNLFEMYKYYKDLCNSYQANSVSKDKIKEKIEEIEKRKQDLLQLPDDCARTLGLEDCDEKIILYKELLEEGE